MHYSSLFTCLHGDCIIILFFFTSRCKNLFCCTVACVEDLPNVQSKVFQLVKRIWNDRNTHRHIIVQHQCEYVPSVQLCHCSGFSGYVCLIKLQVGPELTVIFAATASVATTFVRLPWFMVIDLLWPNTCIYNVYSLSGVGDWCNVHCHCYHWVSLFSINWSKRTRRKWKELANPGWCGKWLLSVFIISPIVEPKRNCIGQDSAQ